MSNQTKQPNNAEKLTCSVCGTRNRPGTIFCETCGANLQTGQVPGVTRSVESRTPTPHNFDELLSAVSNVPIGSEEFTDDMRLRIDFFGAGEALIIDFSIIKQVLLGRLDLQEKHSWMIDLTPHGAYQLGVSRQHAIIRHQDNKLEIIDQGSRNGTSVNGIRLAPNTPRILKNGDTLAMGQMRMQISFEKTEE